MNEPKDKTPRKRRGRRSGGSDTKAALLDAATTLFSTRSFDQVSTRDIGQLAGVDAAMIHHYFGSKEELFRETLNAPLDPSVAFADIFAQPDAAIAERFVRRAVQVWDSPHGAAIFAIVRNVMTNEKLAALARQYIVSRGVRPLVAAVPHAPETSEVREALILAQMAGLLMSRYLLRLRPIAEASTDQIVAWYTPTIHHFLYDPVSINDEHHIAH